MRDFFSGPIITFVMASLISCMPISFLFLRTVSKAASLSRFSISAPVKPMVRRAISAGETSAASFLLRACTLNISSLPSTSGISTCICLSKRPERNSAGSSISALLVAAITIIPSLALKPSISTKSWLRVCSRSSCPPPRPAPRCLPTASISSMKIMQGAFLLACPNKSRTREAPIPTYNSTKSEPVMEKNGTPASPATALASRVFPVPGEPTSKMPLGMRAPISIYLRGSLR